MVFGATLDKNTTFSLKSLQNMYSLTKQKFNIYTDRLIVKYCYNIIQMCTLQTVC